MTERQRVAPRPPAAARSGDEREQVLARRRMALVALVALVPITLIAAIVTGSVVLLIVNLVADLLIALYVALLLQIKQSQSMEPAPRRRPQDASVPGR